MKKSILLTAAGIAVIHHFLSIGLVAVAFGSGMEAFGNPDYHPSMVERVADTLAGIVMQPGMSLWTPWMSENMPDVVEWGVCVLNSLLWGAALSLLLYARTCTVGRKPDSKSVEATS